MSRYLSFMVLATLTVLFCGPSAHAQSSPAAGDSTTIVWVDHLVQVVHAVWADEVQARAR